MRRADTRRIGASPNWFRHSLYYSGWRIPRIIPRGSRIDFDELGEIYPRSQARVDGIDVRRKAVCSDLKVSCCGRVHLLNEGVSVIGIPAPEMPSKDQLACALDGDETVGITAPRIAG